MWQLAKINYNLASVYYIRTTKKGPAIVLSLEGEAQDAVLKLEPNQRTDRNWVKTIIDRLNEIYKKDELTQKYNALEAFETYRRQPNLKIRDFFTEFEKKYTKPNQTEEQFLTTCYLTEF